MGAGQGAGIGNNIPCAPLSPPLRVRYRHAIGTHNRESLRRYLARWRQQTCWRRNETEGITFFWKAVCEDECENNHYAFAIINQINDSPMCKRQHSLRLERNVDFLSFHSHHFLVFLTKVSITLCRRYYEHIIIGNKTLYLSALRMYNIGFYSRTPWAITNRIVQQKESF